MINLDLSSNAISGLLSLLRRCFSLNSKCPTLKQIISLHPFKGLPFLAKLPFLIYSRTVRGIYLFLSYFSYELTFGFSSLCQRSDTNGELKKLTSQPQNLSTLNLLICSHRCFSSSIPNIKILLHRHGTFVFSLWD